MRETYSVALATCNGALYLPELLDSLAGQSLPPSQLVASDDASEDDTIAMLESFAASAAFSVQILRNTKRLGVVKNFSRAISACTSGLVALADQDDVWCAKKTEKLASELALARAYAAFSDAAVVDQSLRSLGYTMWQQAGFTAERQELFHRDQPWDALFKDPVVSGTTLIFRRVLVPLIFPIPDGWIHDAWIAQISASQGRLIALKEPLVQYRQHGRNVVGGRKLGALAQLNRAQALGRRGLAEREFKRCRALRDRLATFPGTARRDLMLNICDAKLEHLSRREALPVSRFRRGPTVLREWINGNYGRFAKDWRNVAADLLMP